MRGGDALFETDNRIRIIFRVTDQRVIQRGGKKTKCAGLTTRNLGLARGGLPRRVLEEKTTRPELIIENPIQVPFPPRNDLHFEEEFRRFPITKKERDIHFKRDQL